MVHSSTTVFPLNSLSVRGRPFESVSAKDGAASLRPEWDKRVVAVLSEAGLELPKPRRGTMGGRKGHHSEHLGHLLSEMQFLQRAYPDARW